MLYFIVANTMWTFLEQTHMHMLKAVIGVTHIIFTKRLFGADPLHDSILTFGIWIQVQHLFKQKMHLKWESTSNANFWCFILCWIE